MVIKNVYWKQSSTKQILGNLTIDGDSFVFTKDETDYAHGSVRIMRKDQYNQEKVNKLFSKLFKKATGVKEDFAFQKSDLQGLTVTTEKFPKQDPKTYRAIPGEFTYGVFINFTAEGVGYVLNIPADDNENYAQEIEGYLK
jgi:hypothetical protein